MLPKPYKCFFLFFSALSAGLQICWLYFLQRDKTPPAKKACPEYGTLTVSDGEAPVLEMWGSVEYLFIGIISKFTLTWNAGYLLN